MRFDCQYHEGCRKLTRIEPVISYRISTQMQLYRIIDLLLLFCLMEQLALLSRPVSIFAIDISVKNRPVTTRDFPFRS